MDTNTQPALHRPAYRINISDNCLVLLRFEFLAARNTSLDGKKVGQISLGRCQKILDGDGNLEVIPFFTVDLEFDSANHQP